MPLQEPGFDESMEAITRHCLEAQKDLSKVSRMLKSLESCASFSCEGDKIEQVLEKCQTTCKNAAHVLREQRLLLKDNNIEEQERIKRWVRFDRLSRSLDSHRAMLNALRSKYTVFTRRLDAEREYRKISSSFDIESHPEAENALLLSQQASHSEKEEYQVMMVSEIEIDSHILSERNEGMQRIQRDMSSVNEIFKDMSTLTEEQGLIIDDLEKNIVKTKYDIDSGFGQIILSNNLQKSGRTRNLCLLILVIAISICLLFLLSVLRS